MKILLADQILATPDREFKDCHLAQKMKNLKRDLRRAVILDVDDIARPYFNNDGKDAETLTLETITLAPPFDLFWVEWGEQGPGYREGVLVRVHAGSMLDAIGPNFQGKDVKWSLEVNSFSLDEKEWCLADEYVYYEIDRSGKVVQYGAELPRSSNRRENFDYGISSNLAIGCFWGHYPAFHAIELLNRKSRSKRDIGDAKAHRAQSRDESIKELLRHKTLTVMPRGKGKIQNAKSSSGYRYALHLTRGHFKTYDESNKLLGRHVGTYWWAPNIRGSKDMGIISKDYRVSP